MKNSGLLLICIFIATLVQAQEKHRFGFVLKAGPHTLPDTRTGMYENFHITSKRSWVVHAGANFQIGIFHAIKLGKRFSFKAELLFRVANPSISLNHEIWDTQGPLEGKLTEDIRTERKFVESSFHLPVMIRYKLSENGKTTVGLGVGISKIAALTVSESYKYERPFFPQQNYQHSFTIGYGTFNTKTSFQFGIYRQLSLDTSLGLELSVEGRRLRGAKLHFDYFTLPFGRGEKEFYLYNPYQDMPRIQNVSIVLNHNILR